VLFGVIVKFEALGLDPIGMPPTATVYQFIAAATAVALRLVVAPAHIVFGLAVTDVGLGHCALIVPKATAIILAANSL